MEDSLYIVGGTIAMESGVYIHRAADRQLLEHLEGAEFCFVLTPRQMGKSSLMVRAAHALRARGARAAVIDLSRFGYNVTADQWYSGLLETLAARLNIDTEMELFLDRSGRLSPAQRWREALREVVLKHIQGRVVIFLDEIDIVRRLKDSGIQTDEFFAGIRSCYNARADDPEYRRLTFCLLGVATPTDLIRDPLITPFNIGTRIELDDFTLEEALPLGRGLGRPAPLAHVLLARIHHWTNGHPYMTQRLCKAVAEDASVTDAHGVDRICRSLFLDPLTGSADDNITFVRQRLTQWDEERLTALLVRYLTVLRRGAVKDDDNAAMAPNLKLSGAVRARNGWLAPRNRIYSAVFNARWAKAALPDSERARIRRAQRKAAMRIGVPSTCAMVLFAVLTFNFNRLRTEAADAKSNYAHLGALLYLKENSEVSALKVLEAVRPAEGWLSGPDRRHFLWRYLWGQCQQDDDMLRDAGQLVWAIAFSPDGKLMATAGQAKQGTHSKIRIRTTATWRVVRELDYPGEVEQMAFTPDGRTLVAVGDLPGSKVPTNDVARWRVPDFNPLSPISFLCDTSSHVGVSPDGRWIAVSNSFETIVRSTSNGNVKRFGISKPTDHITAMAISNKMLVYSSWMGTHLVDLATFKSRFIDTSATQQRDGCPGCLCFSPTGTTLAGGTTQGSVMVWDTRRMESIFTFHDTKSCIREVSFSPDGRLLACACWDRKVRVYNPTSGKVLHRLKGHVDLVDAVAFSPGAGSTSVLVSGGNDGTVRFWNEPPASVFRAREQPASNVERLESIHGRVVALRYGPGGSSGRTGELVDLDTGSDILAGLNPNVQVADFAVHHTEAGELVAITDFENRVFLLSGSPLRELWRFQLPSWSKEEHYGLQFTPDGTRLCATAADTVVYDCRTRRCLPVLKHIFCVPGARAAISPHGDAIAVAGGDRDGLRFGDGTIEAWNLTGPNAFKRAFSIRGASENGIDALKFSEDGLCLIAAGFDQRVVFWPASRLHGDFVGKQELVKGPGERAAPTPLVWYINSGQINAFCYTGPDQGEMAIGCHDGTIHFWDVASNTEHGVLSSGMTQVTALTMLDKDTLVSVSADGKARFWRAAPRSKTEDPARVEWLKESLK